MSRLAAIILFLLTFILFAPGISAQDNWLPSQATNGKYGYKDAKGKIVIKPQYAFAWEFSEGVAAVKIDDKCGFIDSKGRMVIQPSFERAWVFRDGLAMVKQNGKYGFIDKAGNYVIRPEYEHAAKFVDGFAKVTKDGKAGFIDKNGQFYDNEQDVFRSIRRAEQERKHAESAWNLYLAYCLGSKEDFIRKSNIEPLDEAKIKELVEREINAWQVKDEFESTKEWQARVNDQTRNAKAREISQRYVNAYNQKLAAASAEYDRKYAELAAEYKGIATKRFAEQAMTLKPYDADNESFLISTADYGDFLLPVPKTEARDFKANWATIKNGVKAEFVLAGDEMALKSVSFGKYVYDSNTQANYAQVETDYNFRPVEIPNIDYNFQALTDNGSVQAVKTPDNKVITPRTVEPVKTKIALGGVADVDVNIPEGKKKRENTFALVIANENYKRVAEVPYALNDGRVVKEYLRKTLGLPERNIFTVTDASFNDIKYNIKRISDICNAYRGDASVIVYYAGHGVPDEATMDAYLLPVDGYAEAPASSGVSLKSLLADLEQLPTRQTVVLMDACFSGADRNDDMLMAARSVRMRPKDNAVTNSNLVLISATQGNQTAHPYSEKQHGLFTYFLLKKLGESAGDVTLGELTDFIIRGVERQSAVSGKPQTPTITVAPGNTTWPSAQL